MTTPSAEKIPDERCASYRSTFFSITALKGSLLGVPLDAGDEVQNAASGMPLNEMKPITTDSGVIAPAALPFQIGLASLMLMITLISVCLSVASLSPGIGIGLLILLTPAYLRTAFVAQRLRQSGRRLGVAEQTSLWLKSLSIVLAIQISGILAFTGCFIIAYATIGFGYVAIAESLACGMIVSILVALCRWPSEENEFEHDLNRDVNSVQRHS